MNLDKYYNDLINVCKYHDMSIHKIGEIFLDPIYMITPRFLKKHCPTLLIAAGFHGEECAGPLGVLKFLEENKDLLTDVNLSFLPAINPSGLRADKRDNVYNEKTNDGFIHCLKEKMSQEGKLLYQKLELILYHSQHGFLTLHEDVLSLGAYVYTFENNERPGSFSFSFVKTLQQYYPILLDGLSLRGDIERGICNNGIIFNYHDGTFEDLLFHSGVPHTACTETPGGGDLDLRINVNVELIKTFINYHLKEIL